MSERRKGSSGEHPAVAQFRRKADSFDETTIPMLEGLKARVERVGSNPPHSDEGPKPSGLVIVLTLHAAGEQQRRLPGDVARLSAQLVEELRVIGHEISFATIAIGGESVVIDHGKAETP